LPHSDPGVPFFERTSGAVSLSIIANPKFGLPYGTVPRLLLAWICTEAVRTKSPLLGLGRSQNEFLRKLGMRTDGRDCQRLRTQSLRLFSSMLSISYQSDGRVGLKNMPIADEAFVLWDPHRPDDRMLWESTLRLSASFFKNITDSPVPIDMRVLRALSKVSAGHGHLCLAGLSNLPVARQKSPGRGHTLAFSETTVRGGLWR
jgi:hypothetical protein